MILRKLAESIRQQNWFVVVLEILIVVIGIFIGLQVDDWNNRHIALKLEADYLEQLASETDHNLVVYQENAEYSGSAEAVILAYYRYLTGEGIERPDEAKLLGMLCHPGFVSSASYDNSVLEEMIASGMLARLQDITLRSALANYRATQKVWDQLVVDSSDEYKKIFRFIDQFRQWRPATEDEGFGNCTIDFLALESHERALSYVASYQRFSFWYQINFAEIADILAGVRELLPPTSSE
jgi:hypothetical protein